MIKAVFFDIDGTLLSDRGKILKSTRNAIHELQLQGILCGVATGRSPHSIEKMLAGLKLDILVTYNGQYVYSKERVYYARPFPKETVYELASFAMEDNRKMLFGNRFKLMGNHLMALTQNPWIGKIRGFFPKNIGPDLSVVQKWASKIEKKKASASFDTKILALPIYQCILISPESETVELKKRLADCTITRSNPISVDILPRDGSKLIGLAQVADYHGFSLEDIMVFGDGLNDIEMLSGVGIGVAMGNAKEHVQAHADYVTKTNNEDGISFALKHFQLID